MITEEQYQQAIAQEKSAKEVIHQFHKEEAGRFDARWEKMNKGEQYFTDDELIYAAWNRCEKCGAGLAYPKKCGPSHQWTCSNVLKGIGTDKGHQAFPFAFYEIKSENQPSANGATTRPKANES